MGVQRPTNPPGVQGPVSRPSGYNEQVQNPRQYNQPWYPGTKPATERIPESPEPEPRLVEEPPQIFPTPLRVWPVV